MKKFKFILLSLLLCFMVTGTAYAEEEYTIIDGSFSKSSATTLQLGTTYATSINGLNSDNDLYFTFTTPSQKGIINIYQKDINTTAMLKYYLYDKDDNILREGWFDDDDYTETGFDLSLNPSSTYYLVIATSSRYVTSSSGNIKLRISYSYDFGGDEISYASNTSCDKVYTANINGEIDYDWYKFTTGKYSDFIFNYDYIGGDKNGCTWSGCDLIFTVYNAIEENLTEKRLGLGEKTTFSLKLKPETTYYLCVYHPSSIACAEDGFFDTYQFKIEPVRTPISSTSIKLSSTAYTYNGKAKTPTVTVKHAGKTLTKNVDYKVSYSNNTAAGIGKVTITGIGAYKGTTTKTFTIKLPKVTGLKQKNYSTKQVTLTWNKVNKATGYDIFRKDTKTGSYKYIGSTSSTKYTNKELKAGQTYYYVVRAFLKSNGKRVVSGVNSSSLTTTTRPAAPKLTVSSGSKYAKLNWKKVNGGSGYLVYMSTSKNGTYKLMATIGGKASKIATVGKTSITYKQKSLTKGKTYYFKMRSYKTTPSGNKVYSYGYSPIVSVKIK